MKTNLKKKVKVNKSALKRKADKLFSLHVRSYGRCELYGMMGVNCSSQLQTMHIVGRANLRLRYDDNNVFCGCSGHHVWFSFHPEKFWEMVQNNFPTKYEYIVKYRNEKVKATPQFYQEVIDKYSTS
jgi:hypothetical protein